jgi:hypothetical protein
MRNCSSTTQCVPLRHSKAVFKDTCPLAGFVRAYYEAITSTDDSSSSWSYYSTNESPGELVCGIDLSSMYDYGKEHILVKFPRARKVREKIPERHKNSEGKAALTH